VTTQHLADLRFGFAPLPPASPGFYPAADAQSLVEPGFRSPAPRPVPGVQYIGSTAPRQRFVIRVPDVWNGSLVVAGTPATRSEFSSDLIWGELALARGYAFAASNKGIAVNAILEPATRGRSEFGVFPLPAEHADSGAGLALRMGLLWPDPISIDAWNDDYRRLVHAARELLEHEHGPARRVYAVGLSNGGGQVRTLLERNPELVDGGVDWAGVYWSPARSFLDELPAFLRAMPAYVASGYTRTTALAELEALGFPPDVRQADPEHPSLYVEFYSRMPFYADLTVYLYALLIDPEAGADGGGALTSPAARAQYVPSATARRAIASFAHDGSIGKPLVSIAGTHDPLVVPDRHAVGYARAVERAGRAHLHELFLVAGGTHVDAFVPYGYGLRAQTPFAWAAFDRLVDVVERGAPPGNGRIRTIAAPAEIA
jgi:alpha-beta hydrolase superfamily lysophospholipase